MTDKRDALLQRIIAGIAGTGLGDRSLRQLAAEAGSSHRMVLYHFGSREGLVAAIVGAVEADQRRLLLESAATATDAASLIRGVWGRVSDPATLPFVRLFFETVALRTDSDLTEPWIDDSLGLADRFGMAADPATIRLGIAVIRGLLIDVLMTGDVAAATEALERYVALADRPDPPVGEGQVPGQELEP